MVSSASAAVQPEGMIGFPDLSRVDLSAVPGLMALHLALDVVQFVPLAAVLWLPWVLVVAMLNDPR